MKFLDKLFGKINAIALMRIALGVIFLWFGALKVVGISPVNDMISSSFGFMGENFILILGIVEIVIGLGLIFKKFIRPILVVFFLQMLGTFSTIIFNTGIFFDGGNPFLLTMEGEFLVKNLLLISAGLVIWKEEFMHNA